MNKESYNSQAINEYLLGSLPAAEIEALDELSFTDDEFADALRVAEKDLVDAYVQGELRGAQLEQFESYYLASPRRHEKVKFAQAFQVFAERGMVAQAEHPETEKSAGPRAKREKSRWLSASRIFPTAPRLALQWGTALVALAALLVGGWLALQNVRLQRQVSQGQARQEALDQREAELQKELADERSLNSKTEEELSSVREERARLEQALKRQEEQRLSEEQRANRQSSSGSLIASFILTPQVRDAGPSRTLTIPAQTRSVTMQLKLEPNDFLAYKVALLEQPGNQTLWRSNQLRARGQGESQTLNLNFPARLLKSQRYVLQVTGIRADGSSESLSDYPFKVVK